MLLAGGGEFVRGEIPQRMFGCESSGNIFDFCAVWLCIILVVGGWGMGSVFVFERNVRTRVFNGLGW